jgi:Flp pilus assembly protein TadG
VVVFVSFPTVANAALTSAQQRGNVLILTAVSLAVLIGFLGIVIDLGRLFVNKTELQTAMDACALAASAELRPNVVPSDMAAVTRAVSTGITAGNRNKIGFQGSSPGLTSNDIYFSDRLSDNSTTFPFGYVSSVAANPATAKYVLCARTETGIATWFMQVLESAFGGTSTTKSVGAWATATTAPAQTNCGVPIGMCKLGTPPNYGFTPGQWISGRFDSGGGSTGNFNWIDFSPPSGGASELGGLLSGTGQCNLAVNNPVGQTGILGNAAAKAWNSRFGLYQGGGGNPNLTSAPPDYTGYAYTPVNWPSQSAAFGDFQAKRAAHASYGNTTDTVAAGNDVTGLSISNGYNVATHGASGELATNGADRRVAVAPIVDCTQWQTQQTVPILDWACVLMLHPISSPGDSVHLEYLGRANVLGSPCASYGLAGGTAGPMVPVLVH